ncbi:SDR family oxidoreductase [Flavobacteriaceae bacterium 14752]|uniref:SDR family oxidoreductase n=1 Tax=Mesohalobacter salilacus TaxID=2491711 RepID=UPI000F62E8E9|nr:SDR family oxidoreductase [Flavobacteriaceae bacterium 14752]
MKILLTGANGYIGMRLLPLLLNQNHDIVCAVRDKKRLSVDKSIKSRIDIVEVDFLEDKPVNLPEDIDVAYYLIHSMSSSTTDFDDLEARAAKRFVELLKPTNVKQVIYLSGIVNQKELSKHLQSRKQVEHILSEATFALTVIRAGIIVGSGSASFEILRDLCEKLPIMITPKWVNTKSQPIAIRDVLFYLTNVINRKDCYNQAYDVAGPDTMTYKDMMKAYAEVRELPLNIINVPVMTPKLSSYWLYFVTATSYKLAQNLVDSMKVDVTTQDYRLQEKLNHKPLNYKKAIRLAFDKIEQNQVISSWKDSKVSGRFSKDDLNRFVKVPKFGCLIDHQSAKVDNPQKTIDKIWEIGGKTGWYYANTLWKIRGFIDKVFGGVGLRRGRTNTSTINPGDALDFWRVILADKDEKRLLLFAEMKVPGEAWLEFYIDEDHILHQNATFRPRGLKGRLYWYSMLPFHYFIFAGMLNRLAKP